MTALSHAQQAKTCDPFGCGLPKSKAFVSWHSAKFIGDDGQVIKAAIVHNKRGIVSVEFPDGSILCPPHWQM